MYTETIVGDEPHALEVMRQMEEEFRKGDETFFVKVLKEENSLVLRVHAVTILADLGQEAAVEALSDVLLHDPDPLVRHEAAFSIGQIGLSSGNVALAKAAVEDGNPVVRHESCAALGSIGSQSSRKVLEQALGDPEDIVSNSARASIFNLNFLEKYSVGGSARERAPRP